MHHQRHAHGLEAPSGQFRALGGGGGRQPGSGDVREVDAGLFEHRPVAQDASAAAARESAIGCWTLPSVFREDRRAVGGFEGLGQPVL